MLVVAILEVAIQTTEIVLLLKVELLPITNHLQGSNTHNQMASGSRRPMNDVDN
jgi:hypothetical protein